MRVTYLNGRSSPLAASSASPFHPRSDETSSLRLARPTADLRNGITDHPPSSAPPLTAQLNPNRVNNRSL